MKVELSIADDRELRAHVRNIIKGEVVSIARGEIKAIIAEVVGERIIPKDQVALENIIREIIREQVKREFCARSYMKPSWIQNETRKQIADILADAFQNRKVM